MLMNLKYKGKKKTKKGEQKKVGTGVCAAWFHLKKSIKMQKIDRRKQTVVEERELTAKRHNLEPGKLFLKKIF